MKLTKKRIITENKDDISPYDFEGTLTDLRKKIDDLINQYGPTAKLDWDPYFTYQYEHSASPRYWVLVSRDETDEEMTARLRKEKEEKDCREEQERAEFERLQKKFGDKK